MDSTNGSRGVDLAEREAQVRDAKQQAVRMTAEADAREKDAKELGELSQKGRAQTVAYGKQFDKTKSSIDDIKRQLDESCKAISDAMECGPKARVDAQLEALDKHLAGLRSRIDELDAIPEPTPGSSVAALTRAQDDSSARLQRTRSTVDTLLKLPEELQRQVSELTKHAKDLSEALCTTPREPESNYLSYRLLEREYRLVVGLLQETNEYANEIKKAIGDLAAQQDGRRSAATRQTEAEAQLKNARDDLTSVRKDPKKWVEAAQSPAPTADVS